MKRVQVVVLALGLVVTGCVSAPVADRKAAEAATGYQVVTSLTTEVGARLAGSPKNISMASPMNLSIVAP